MVEVQIGHVFVNPQPDDVGPDTYVKPKHWNAIETFKSNGAADGDLVTYNPGSSTLAGYRTLVGGTGITVTVNPTNITIATAGSVITGSGTTGKLPKWSGSNTLTDSIVTEGTGLLDIAGASASYNVKITDNVNGARLRFIAGSVTGDIYNSGGELEMVTQTAHAVALYTNATRRFTIDSSGRAALGTSTPNTFEYLALKNTFAPSAAGGVLGISATVTAVVGASHYGIDCYPTINKAGSGTHTTFASAAFEAVTVGAGAATLTNTATVLITGASGAGTNNYGLWSQGGSHRVDSAGPHSWGGAGSVRFAHYHLGSFTAGTGGFGVGMELATSITGNSTNSIYGLDVDYAFTLAAAAAVTDVAWLLVQPAAVSLNGGSLTNAAGIKIISAPSGATNNYAVWSTGGSWRIDSAGPHSIGGSITGNIAVEIKGSFTPAGANQVEGLSIRGTYTPNGGFNGFGAVWSPTIATQSGAVTVPLAVGAYFKVTAQENGSGVITTSTSIYVDAPSGSNVDNSASVYIAAGPVNGTAVNYALWVDSGKTRLDNQLTIPTYDSHVIGSLTGNTGVGFLITSSFASGQSFARVLQIDATATANADSGSLVGIYLNPALTERGAGTHGLLAGMYVAPTVVAGAATTTNFSGIYIDAIVAQSGTTNAAALTIGAAPTGATTNYGILAAGSMRFTDAVSHSFGTTLDADVMIKVAGTFAGSANTYAIHVNNSLTGIASGNIIGIRVTPTLVEAGSGTHAVEAGIYVQPTVTAGAGNATDAAGILIDTFAAASGTTNASGLKVVVPTGSATNTYGIWTTGSLRADKWFQLDAPNIRTDAGNAYTLTDTDNFVIVNKAAVFTLTLPAASSFTGRMIWIETYTANAVNSATSNVNSKTGVNGTAILTGVAAGQFALLVSDGTNWLTIATNQ